MPRSTVRQMLVAGAAALVITPAVGGAQTGDTLSRVQLESVELEFAEHGAPTGEAVLLIHAGVFHDWWEPLIAEPALGEHYRLIRYNRVGYGGSSQPAGPVSIADNAAHAAGMLRALGVERAHIVGHSSGASIALQLALDAPDAVASLTLLEPARPDNAATAALRGPGVGRSLELFRIGQRAVAVDTFMEAVTGPGYRQALESVAPHALAQAEVDADIFFGHELPALAQWQFSREDAQRIVQPALTVVGSDSGPVFRARHELLLEWLPNVESYELPRASHLLYLQNPADLAQALADFYNRHSMPSS